MAVPGTVKPGGTCSTACSSQVGQVGGRHVVGFIFLVLGKGAGLCFSTYRTARPVPAARLKCSSTTDTKVLSAIAVLAHLSSYLMYQNRLASGV